MNNEPDYMELDEPPIGKEAQMGAVSELSDLLSALRKLADEWHKEYGYLSGPDDDPQDKAVGKAFLQCEFELRKLL